MCKTRQCGVNGIAVDFIVFLSVVTTGTVVLIVCVHLQSGQLSVGDQLVAIGNQTLEGVTLSKVNIETSDNAHLLIINK